jgi:predicted  nucleic acid-binding Zn-ribbon protein
MPSEKDRPIEWWVNQRDQLKEELDHVNPAYDKARVELKQKDVELEELAKEFNKVKALSEERRKALAELVRKYPAITDMLAPLI